MIASLGLFLHELLHPGSLGPHGGYWFWSGIGSDIGEAAIVGGIVTLVRHHSCHIDGCRRLGHIDPAVHAPACKNHHSHRDLRGKMPPAKRSR